jgi:SAM-dependent methyltransferase
MRTYTHVSGNARGVLRDVRQLLKIRRGNVAGDVRTAVELIGRVESAYAQRCGAPLMERDVLVVGAGQTPREVIGFGARNRVVAIDLDVLPHGWRPGQYLRLLRTNGPTRAGKTVGRKLLGIDRSFDRALRERLGATAVDARYLQMDAARMTFRENEFDLAYSFSVFEHLPEPEQVLREAVRVLRPGGLLYVSVHLYAAEGGCHDLRIFAGNREAIPWWAHLRPKHKHLVVESCYMNEWRLEAWESMFARVCPGAEFRREPHHQELDTTLRTELAALRAAGELSSYSDDELLTVNLMAIWRKPV